MTPQGHNDLFPAIETALKEATEPLDCNQLFSMSAINKIAPSANRVSDYLGVLFRRGLVTRLASGEREGSSRARWKYIWREKKPAKWKQAAAAEAVEYAPKAILDRPNVYITEDGANIHIELPALSITIKKK